MLGRKAMRSPDNVDSYETAIAEELLRRLDVFVQYWNNRSEEELQALPRELRWFAGRVARRYQPGRLVPATKVPIIHRNRKY